MILLATEERRRSRSTMVNPAYVIYFDQFRRLLEAADDIGLDIAPLKGAHLLTAVYPPDEAHRGLGDIDFLVRPNDWDRTIDLLRRLGWQEPPQPRAKQRYHQRDFEREVAGLGTLHFELHRYVLEQYRFHIDHDALWARARRSSFDGAPCLRLAAEDHLVHVALHAATHGLTNLTKALRDFELLLHSDELEPDRLEDRAREWEATRVVWLFLVLLADSGRGPEIISLRRQLRPPWLVRRQLRRLVPDCEAQVLDGYHAPWRGPVLWPWLFDHPWHTAGYYVNRLRVRVLQGVERAVQLSALPRRRRVARG
jgi:hypothetical protein